MKDKKFLIRIKRSPKDIINFLLNPQNTPLWIESIVKEEAKPYPPVVGTIYRNQDMSGKWNSYKVVRIKENKMFEFASNDGNYHVRYDFKKVGDKSTELTYFEWVEKGKLDEPFSIDVLERLKAVIEDI
ncbi:hypothetical protein M1271_01125 [Patescibacteria group bacterium]|nr:hypothetical protein [Patescibacteria group bacterium]MCL5798410.1 hypothetical protein [Patescibacteria group bacterium]